VTDRCLQPHRWAKLAPALSLSASSLACRERLLHPTEQRAAPMSSPPLRPEASFAAHIAQTCGTYVFSDFACPWDRRRRTGWLEAGASWADAPGKCRGPSERPPAVAALQPHTLFHHCAGVAERAADGDRVCRNAITAALAGVPHLAAPVPSPLRPRAEGQVQLSRVAELVLAVECRLQARPHAP
jgi:hypothetical protein